MANHSGRKTDRRRLVAFTDREGRSGPGYPFVGLSSVAESFDYTFLCDAACLSMLVGQTSVDGAIELLLEPVENP